MNIKLRLKKIRLIISDVDGVITDGTIIKGADNLELKRFCVQDGTAVVMAKTAGFQLAFISGRYSKATEIRLKELKVSDVYNGTLNKLIPYEELKKKYQLKDDEIAYIGDDLIDIPVMEKVGLPVAVYNAYPDVKEKAIFVTKTRGGEGAFREFIDWMLLELGTYKKRLEDIKKMVNDLFYDHPGDSKNYWLGSTRKDALKALDLFIIDKINNFGDYEDAVRKHSPFLFHSVLSPYLNLGLITPKDVIKKVLDANKIKEIPINSLEGFIRQLIGWREFMRGIYPVSYTHLTLPTTPYV